MALRILKAGRKYTHNKYDTAQCSDPHGAMQHGRLWNMPGQMICMMTGETCKELVGITYIISAYGLHGLPGDAVKDSQSTHGHPLHHSSFAHRPTPMYLLLPLFVGTWACQSY